MGHATRPRGRLLVPLTQRDRDIDLQREAGGGRVEAGDDPADDPGFLESPDAVQGRRRRKADNAGELDIGAVRVGLKFLEQAKVN